MRCPFSQEYGAIVAWAEKMSRNTHVLAFPDNVQITLALYADTAKYTKN
jgi:hypothetical protein